VHGGPVTTAAFSRDGTRIVTGSDDRTARIWDAMTGRPLIVLRHRGTVTATAFSPDGARVATASKDAVQLWDITTGEPVIGPLTHGGPVASVAFSPDGARLVTASQDSTAWVWDLSVGLGSLEDWQRLLRCSPFTLANREVIASRDLTRECARR
jgi:WD40 repeat protein